jgi:sortase A
MESGFTSLRSFNRNFKEHFGRLDELEPGDELSFTDMDGRTAYYAVERLEILDPNAVDAVQYSGCDLVLYTCTYGGANRTAVFCSRK